MMPQLSKSPRVNALLARMGVFTYLDAIECLPRRYEDFSPTRFPPLPIDGERLVLFGKVAQVPARALRFKRASLVRFELELPDGRHLPVEAWNRDYLASRLKPGSNVTVSGRYDSKRRCLNLMALKEGEIPPEERLKAVHALPEGLTEAVFAGIVKRGIAALKGTYVDPIPPSIREKYRLLDVLSAYEEIHFPRNSDSLRAGMRTLKYLEAFLYELLIHHKKGENRSKRPLHERKIDLTSFKMFAASLPYELTPEQKEAVNRAYLDLSSPYLMKRLLQGDVGTGKTLVASLVLYLNYLRGYQGALLAPTEALARQHHASLTALFKDIPIRITLLTGGLEAGKRHDALLDIKTGVSDIVVGTHALFSENVEYASLHLAVIDEQHKFGVDQRLHLIEKGEGVDVYMMSATPIPRSLAQAVYGDLDISSLHQFPGGKRKVVTKICPYHDERTQEAVREALGKGERVYVIAKEIHGDSPVSSAIEIYRRYNNLYPGKAVLMTGENTQEELTKALSSFKAGTTPILVATQVVEVGLDVREASLMLVYDASRFSLSSLHQLRGRIGRDGREALFLLLSDRAEASKLKILAETDDGFKISEEDLRLRGPGELFGKRQSGEISFRSLDPVDDLKILQAAQQDVESLFERDRAAYEEALSYAEERKNKGDGRGYATVITSL